MNYKKEVFKEAWRNYKLKKKYTNFSDCLYWAHQRIKNNIKYDKNGEDYEKYMEEHRIILQEKMI